MGALSPYPDRHEVRTERLFAAGVLLFGLTFILRFHIAPAIAVAVAYVSGLQVRWLPLLVGASIPSRYNDAKAAMNEVMAR